MAIADGLANLAKQENSILRFFLVEAAQVAARSIPQRRSKYFHLSMRRGKKIAKELWREDGRFV